VVRGLGTKPVRLGERALEVAQVEVARQRRELVRDHLGLRLRDHARHLLRVESIGDGGRRAEIEDRLALGLAARSADHLVAARHEPGNELLPERSCGTCNQDLHGFSHRRFLLLTTREGPVP
jgi:hypothetical protein